MNCELVEVCYLLSCLFMDPAYVLVDVRFVINNNNIIMIQSAYIYKVSATFPRYYMRYQRQLATATVDTDIMRVMAAYDAILVSRIIYQYIIIKLIIIIS